MKKTEKTPLATSAKPIDQKDPPAKSRGGEDEGRYFSSTFALVCTMLGSAVGTGNVWRFSRVTAQSAGHSGALAFLLIWILFLFVWSIPMLLLEYAAGRYTRKGVIQSFYYFLGPKAIWCGAWITFVALAICSYYTVITGWCLYYFFYTAIHPLPSSYQESMTIFTEFAGGSPWPVLTHLAIALITGLILLRGVTTIERANVVMAPTLLVMMVAVLFWSVARPNALSGLKFLFTMDWEVFRRAEVWVTAASQNAFDTGGGTGTLIAYAVYMTRSHGVVKYAIFIPMVNNLVSLLCGMTTFSTAFGSLNTEHPNMTTGAIVDVLKESGPGSTGIAFIWLPVLMGEGGTLGRVVLCVYFLCLIFAGISSNIAYMETVLRSAEDLGAPRHLGVIAIMCVVFLIGLGSALDVSFLESQDFTWGMSLLVNGLMLQIMVIVFSTKIFRQQVINDYSHNDWYMPAFWEWIIKLVAPLVAIVLLGWWVVDTIIQSYTFGAQPWYEFHSHSLTTVIVQWLGVMSILVLINILVILYRPQWYERWRSRANSQPMIDDDTNSTQMASSVSYQQIQPEHHPSGVIQ